MVKTLPIIMPTITSYAHHAHIFAIPGDNEIKNKWLCNNYIQLQASITYPFEFDFCIGHRLLTNFNNCPWIARDGINKEMISLKWNMITNCVIDCISLNYYVLIELDTFYIKEYENFNKKHLNRLVLIFGYNKYKKTFEIADFFKNGKYDFGQISFDEIEDAYLRINETKYLDGIYLVFRKNNIENYEISIPTIYNLLNDYLFSFNSNCRNIILNDLAMYNHEYLYSYGFEVYNFLIDWIKNNNEGGNEFFYCLFEHKKIIMHLIEYLGKRFFLNKSSIIGNKYVEVFEKSKLILRVKIKYDITKSEIYKNKIIDIIKEVKELEKILFTEMIENIYFEPHIDIFSEGLIDSTKIFSELGYSESYVHFCGIDIITKGNWIGKYGFQGFWLPNIHPKENDLIRCYLPDTFINTKEDCLIDDESYLVTPYEIGNRIFSSCYRNYELIIILVVLGDTKRKISIYMFDIDKKNEKGIIEIYSYKTRELLHSFEITNNNLGVYYSYEILGSVLIKIRIEQFACWYQHRFGEIFGMFYD